jgi:hypothetical protein
MAALERAAATIDQWRLLIEGVVNDIKLSVDFHQARGLEDLQKLGAHHYSGSNLVEVHKQLKSGVLCSFPSPDEGKHPQAPAVERPDPEARHVPTPSQSYCP